MKKFFLFCLVTFFILSGSHAQGVTLLNNNNSLFVEFPLSNGKTIIVSDIDSSLWATNATPGGTIQISPDIKFEESGGLLSGKLVFRGSRPSTGSELYMTDGTPGGTSLISDVYAGPLSSDPSDFATLNGFVYFSARTALQGREIWKTNGTTTSILQDIVPGIDSSNRMDEYNMFSNGAYLLFAARIPGSGVELWKSDGTTTVMLKEINTGNANADSSNPREFYALNSVVLFAATDATHGEEIWRTDGTPGGTSMLKDINTGTDSSTYFNVMIAPGFFFPSSIFQGFHTFNNRAYFNASDGASTGEIWSTDGSVGNATLLKDVVPGTSIPSITVLNAINVPGKFMFPVNNPTTPALWESDGSTVNTKVFKSFSTNGSGQFVFILLPYSFNFTTGTLTFPLFQGNKFFFGAPTAAAGEELWISDGTLGGTSMVKDINPGTGSGFSLSGAYVYTTAALFFVGNDGASGNELWKSDGTVSPTGTSRVADINPLANDADPQLPIFLCNGKVIFSADDGNDLINNPANTDLYVVNGTFTALPIQLADFTVTATTNDALLQWSTSQETNSKNFTIQRSYDARNFENIGTMQAAGTSANSKAYSFTDIEIMNSGKSEVYYRLLSTDLDGKIAYSKVILLKLKPNSGWIVRVVSNPVKGNVNVLLQGITGNVRLSIQDISGKTVFSNSYQNINGQITLNSNLQSGAYLLVAENNKERKVTKFIK